MDDIDRYLALWTAVLQVTVCDLQRSNDAIDRIDAARWALSDAKHPCSFNWACDILDIGEPIYATIRQMAKDVK